jgi:hypothetical protein
MRNDLYDWSHWQSFFARRSERQLPELEDRQCYSEVPSSVAKSLAIFQLGESGGGSVIEQARQSNIKGIDHDYADAMELFVNEEHRHAEILAICVRNLGGTLIRSNWTAKLFVFARRLIGLRLKVMVLLAAEIVGICYYHLLATRLPQSRLKSLLAQLVNDERAHLHFHCTFLRLQSSNFWRKMVFRLTWRVVMLAAAVVVLIDHRHAIRDLNLTTDTVWRRWMSYGDLARRLVLNQQTGFTEDLQILDSGSNPREVISGADVGLTANYSVST